MCVCVIACLALPQAKLVKRHKVGEAVPSENKNEPECLEDDNDDLDDDDREESEEEAAEYDGPLHVAARADKMAELRYQSALASSLSTPPSSKSKKSAGAPSAKDLTSLKKKLSFDAAAEPGGSGSKADAKSSAGDEEKHTKAANGWLAKLDLMSTLKGKKLGVEGHHAEEALAKLTLGSAIAISLKAHLKNYRRCKELSPHHVASRTPGEIKEALDDLEGFIHEWPQQLQMTLWQKACASRVSQALQVQSDEAFGELMKCVAPYPPEGGQWRS